MNMLYNVQGVSQSVSQSVCVCVSHTKTDPVGTAVHQFSRDDTGADDEQCDEEADNGPGVGG